jgi:hypothetical protein
MSWAERARLALSPSSLRRGLIASNGIIDSHALMLATSDANAARCSLKSPPWRRNRAEASLHEEMTVQ